MKIVEIGPGVSLVEIPESGLSVLCGCPENVYKLLKRAGSIVPVAAGGATWESGPNAILLSELPMQGGRFCNVVEFPVLQMLYRQGMIIPGHPNNRGLKPMLIGHREDLEATARYIHLGNYGLDSVAALVAAGMGEAEAEELLSMKRAFAFGHFKPAEELLEFREIEGPAVELRGGTFLRRTGPNRYCFIHGGEKADVDLNLPAGSRYGLAYELPRGAAPREDFAVVHLGEGDGWDVERPCMSSLVVHRGGYWLVDAGPQVRESLGALGLGVEDLRGVFLTHAHDDHMAGLTAFLDASRRIGFFAVPWVRTNVQEKLRALAGLDAAAFRDVFEVVDLREGEWNGIEGFEVLPFFSPHPLETTCLRFRSATPNGSKCYAHLADLSSFAVIDAMVREDPSRPGISRALAERAKASYLEPADLKKVDVGGGMIHGAAGDFEGDLSGELLLSHGLASLPAGWATRGRIAGFGEVSVLAPASSDYRRESALGFLRLQFEGLPIGDLLELLVEAPREHAEGGVIARRGESPAYVELILSGSVEVESGERHCAGGLVGEVECLSGTTYAADMRCATRVESWPIPSRLFASFIARHGLTAERAERFEKGKVLLRCEVFADVALGAEICRLASGSSPRSYAAGDSCPVDELQLVLSGRIGLAAGGRRFAEIGACEVFGEESLLDPGAGSFSAWALGDSEVLVLSKTAARAIPQALWRLRELLARRFAAARGTFDFGWRQAFSVGVQALDDQHRGLFGELDAIVDEVSASEACLDLAQRVVELKARFLDHFETEERLMEGAGFEGLAAQRKQHAAFAASLGEWELRLSNCDLRTAKEFSELLADWLLGHTLGLDRGYIGKLG